MKSEDELNGDSDNDNNNDGDNNGDGENLWHALPILALLYLDLGQQGGGAVHVVVWLNLDEEDGY